MLEWFGTTHKRAMCRFRDIFWHCDTEPTELYFSIISMLWGLWLLAPAESFTTSQAFTAMAGIAPEQVWGMVILCVGALRLHALATGNWLARKSIAFLAALFWIFVALMFAMSSIASTGVPVYTLHALASIWVYVRLPGGGPHGIGTGR